MRPLCEGSPSSATSPVVAEEASSGCTFAGSSCAEFAGGSHFPSFVIAIGTTSNFFRSMLSMIARAERMETSCSPERPPKITPTRSFFGTIYDLPFAVLVTACCAARASPRHQLKYGFSQSGKNQFDAQLGRPVIDVQCRIYLDEFERTHAAMLGDLFHREMRFAISESTANECARTGRVAGIECV